MSPSHGRRVAAAPRFLFFASCELAHGICRKRGSKIATRSPERAGQEGIHADAKDPQRSEGRAGRGSAGRSERRFYPGTQRGCKRCKPGCVGSGRTSDISGSSGSKICLRRAAGEMRLRRAAEGRRAGVGVAPLPSYAWGKVATATDRKPGKFSAPVAWPAKLQRRIAGICFGSSDPPITTPTAASVIRGVAQNFRPLVVLPKLPGWPGLFFQITRRPGAPGGSRGADRARRGSPNRYGPLLQSCSFVT